MQQDGAGMDKILEGGLLDLRRESCLDIRAEPVLLRHEYVWPPRVASTLPQSPHLHRPQELVWLPVTRARWSDGASMSDLEGRLSCFLTGMKVAVAQAPLHSTQVLSLIVTCDCYYYMTPSSSFAVAHVSAPRPNWRDYSVVRSQPA